MKISKKFSFSLYFMLVLIETAFSLPVGDNNKLTHEKPKTDDVLSERSDKELVAVIPAIVEEPSQIDAVETYKNLTELLNNLVKQESADVKAKADSFVKHLKSFEANIKLSDLLPALPNAKVDEAYNNLAERLRNLFKEELANVKPKFDYLKAHINSVESNDKLKDLMSELSDQKLVENYNKWTDQLNNLIKKELSGVKAKFDNFITSINSMDNNRNLKGLLAELFHIKLEETYKVLTERLLKLIKNNLAGPKAKLNGIDINSAKGNKKLKEELSNLELDETYMKLKKRLPTLVKEELADVKAKFDDLVNQINSIQTNDKLKALLAELCNLKLYVTYKRLTERLINLVKQELAGVTSKLDVTDMNSTEIDKKLKVFLAELSDHKLEGIYQTSIDRLTKLVEGEVNNVKVKFDILLTHIQHVTEKNV